MDNISKYMSVNNENPHKLPQRDSRELNVVARIYSESSMKSAMRNVDDEVVEKRELNEAIKNFPVNPPSLDYTVLVTETISEGYAKAYRIQQSATNLDVMINIPKDMVVESGNLVTNPTGMEEGMYLRLVLANATEDEIFIPVSSLITQITSGSQSGDMIIVSIDSVTNKVTATLSDGSITKSKLNASVQASLDKSDTALQPSNAPGYDDILTKTSASATYVVKNGTDRLMTVAEGAKLAGIYAGATKVEKASGNGTLRINGTDFVVYEHPDKHQISDVEDLQTALDSKLEASDLEDINLSLANKLEASDIADKADKSEVSALEASLANKLEASDIVNKADKSDTLAGYGITDTYTKAEIDAMFAALSNPTV